MAFDFTKGTIVQPKSSGFDFNSGASVTPDPLNGFSVIDHGLSTVKATKTLADAANDVGSIFPGKKVGEAIGTAAGALYTKAKDAITGSNDFSQYDLNAPSPLQTVGDVAKGAALVSGGSITAPSSLLGNTALGAGLGALGGAGEAATKTSGETIPTAQDLSQTGKGGLVGGLVGGILSGATNLVGRIIQKTGDKIQLTSIKPSLADIEDGFSIDTIKKNDLGGSLSTVYQKTQSKLSDLTQQLNEKLASTDSGVNLFDVFEKTKNSLVTNKVKGFGSNTSIGNAVKQLEDEIANINSTGRISIPEAQLVKQASGKMGAWQYGATSPEATAREVVYNNFYKQLKTTIENNSPEGVKEINKQLSELIPVLNAVVRRIPVAERNGVLSLTDMLTATASMFNPHALVGLGISLAQKEGSVGNLLSKLGPALAKLAPPASLGGTAASAILPSNEKQ